MSQEYKLCMEKSLEQIERLKAQIIKVQDEESTLKRLKLLEVMIKEQVAYEDPGHSAG